MNQIEIGKFIVKCRKEKKITQAQLAEKLNITDRAVSKWETGKSMPDSSIMLELCQLLGITVNELLSGEKVNMDSLERKADENLIALKKKVDNNIAKNIIIAVLFSVILFIGILVCTICDIAVSGSLSWSLIPIISIIFVWLISFPSIMFGKKGIVKSLISLSIFVVPYIYLLSRLIKVKTVFQIGTVMAIASVAFLWLIFTVLCRVGKTRKLFSLGLITLLAIPFVIIVNALVAVMIKVPFLDVWDFMVMLILVIVAVAFFMCDYAKKKGLLKEKQD